MADVKTTALTLLTDADVDPADLIRIVDSSAIITKAIALKHLIPSGINNILFKTHTADATAQSVATAQPWFPTAGAVAVEAAKTYFMEGSLLLGTGTTSHTTGLSFGGTATLTSIDYQTWANSQAANATVTTGNNTLVSQASNTVVTAASTAVITSIGIMGIIRINAAGTLIPQFQFSVNPTGTNVVKRNSFFRLYPLGSNTVVSRGTWS